MSKIRINRIEEEIKRELSHIINTEVKDPRINGLISITDVEVSGDLKYAKIFISSYASEKEQEQVLEGLEKAKGFLRTGLAQRVRVRSVPELIFKSDNSLEYGAKITRILKEIKDNQGGEDVGTPED